MQTISTSEGSLLLEGFVLLSSNCGARPGEMRELKWGQVRNHKYPDGEQRMVAEFPSGKTGKRESVFNVGSDVFFKRLWDFRWEELGHAPSPDEFVFCSRDGSKVIDRKKSFASLLNYCGLRTNVAGELRSLYSLRHFYAHQQLRNDPPTSVYDLARNMGTSVKVIESNMGTKTMSPEVKTLVAKVVLGTPMPKKPITDMHL